MITEQEMMIPLLLSKSFLIFNSIINVLILQYLQKPLKCSSSSNMRTSVRFSAFRYIAFRPLIKLKNMMKQKVLKVPKSLILSRLARQNER